MKCLSLSLYGFRNFAQVERLELPGEGLLVVKAQNATGKTNLLEALVVLLRGKSWRASHQSCVQWGEGGFIVAGEFLRQREKHLVAVRYQAESRKVRIEEDGEPVSPVTFYQRYPFILFTPDDTFIFQRSPAQRRNFINSVLVASPGYVASLVQYQRALRQRNTALKRARAADEASVWTDLAAEHGEVIWQQRGAFISYLNTHLSGVYQAISGEAIDFSVRLVQSAKPGELRSALEAVFPQEQRYKYTIHGPHRDDVEIVVRQPRDEGSRQGDEIAATAVLSQGQMRDTVIASKIIASNFLTRLAGEEPLLLMDEVLGELDEDRQRALLSHLNTNQVIITTTHIPKGIGDKSHVHVLQVDELTAVQSSVNTTQSMEVVVEAEPEAMPAESEDQVEVVQV